MGAPGGCAREYPHGAHAFACLRVCVSARVHLHTRMFMHVHTRVRAPVRPRREGGTTHGSSTARRPLCGSRSRRSPPAAALGPERASELSGVRRRRGRWGSGRREGGGPREGGGSGTFWSSLTGAREAGKDRRTAQCRRAAGRVRASWSGGKGTRSRRRRPPSGSRPRAPPAPCCCPGSAGCRCLRGCSRRRPRRSFRRSR